MNKRYRKPTTAISTMMNATQFGHAPKKAPTLAMIPDTTPTRPEKIMTVKHTSEAPYAHSCSRHNPNAAMNIHTPIGRLIIELNAAVPGPVSGHHAGGDEA